MIKNAVEFKYIQVVNIYRAPSVRMLQMSCNWAPQAGLTNQPIPGANQPRMHSNNFSTIPNLQKCFAVLPPSGNNLGCVAVVIV